MSNTCPLCSSDGGVLVVSTSSWRLVRVIDAPGFPAFYRLIWSAHVAEWSGLSSVERRLCADLLAAIEQVLIQQLAPTKINLASLGNVVPHLHWHVVARFDWDSHFPQPIWGAAVRTFEGPAQARLRLPLEALDDCMRQALGGAEFRA